MNDVGYSVLDDLAEVMFGPGEAPKTQTKQQIWNRLHESEKNVEKLQEQLSSLKAGAIVGAIILSGLLIMSTVTLTNNANADRARMESNR